MLNIDYNNLFSDKDPTPASKKQIELCIKINKILQLINESDIHEFTKSEASQFIHDNIEDYNF